VRRLIITQDLIKTLIGQLDTRLKEDPIPWTVVVTIYQCLGTLATIDQSMIPEMSNFPGFFTTILLPLKLTDNSKSIDIALFANLFSVLAKLCTIQTNLKKVVAEPSIVFYILNTVLYGSSNSEYVSNLMELLTNFVKDEELKLILIDENAFEKLERLLSPDIPYYSDDTVILKILNFISAFMA